jgi:hypothetical protein
MKEFLKLREIVLDAINNLEFYNGEVVDFQQPSSYDQGRYDTLIIVLGWVTQVLSRMEEEQEENK